MFDLKNYIEQTYARKPQPPARQPLIEEEQYQRTNELSSPTQDTPRTGGTAGRSQHIQQQYGAAVPETNTEIEEPKFNAAAAVSLLMFYSIAIALVVYGSIHLKDCPAQHMIPVSFVVAGSLSLLSRIISCQQECRSIISRDVVLPNPCLLCLKMIVELCIMCFFLAICVWIFTINPDTKDETSSNYCQKELYNNTWYGCIVGLVLFGLAFILTCCGVCSVMCTLVAQGIPDD